MKSTSHLDIQFIGNNLNVNNLSKDINLPLESIVSAGEIAKLGRYKGLPSPYGIGLLKIDPSIESITYYTDILLNVKDSILKNNVEEIIYDVDANSEDLENITLTSSIMMKLSLLNAKIQFNKHEISNNNFSSLIDKINLKISTLSNLNKKDFQDILNITSKTFEDKNLKPEYAYAIIVTYLETLNGNNKQLKSKLKKAAEEFDHI
jgi:hypothetical protein